MQKEEGYAFWRNTLKGAQYVVAPMVDQSELAWRMLSRKYKAQLCYTPMFHSSVFARDPHYRKENLQTCFEDRPLIVQFCGNDPDIIVTAAKMAEDFCDAIDLNLGCPQMIAKRGHYGAFLQDEWDLLEKIVSKCHKELKVPITCKIRVFESVDKTVQYAQMLERAGCQLLTVHGRTRDMKGKLTGLADWKAIKAVKDAVRIPVFANGNIQYLSDVKRCMEETGVDGVMTAEGNLHNPALFAGVNPLSGRCVRSIWTTLRNIPVRCRISGVMSLRCSTMVYICIQTSGTWSGWHAQLSVCKAVLLIKERGLAEMGKEDFDPCNGIFGRLPLPYWYCQPYVRPSPEEEEENKKKRDLLTRPAVIEELVNVQGLSKKKVKKRLRNPNKDFTGTKKIKFDICTSDTCNNPRGQKCNHNLCKSCCRLKTSEK